MKYQLLTGIALAALLAGTTGALAGSKMGGENLSVALVADVNVNINKSTSHSKTTNTNTTVTTNFNTNTSNINIGFDLKELHGLTAINTGAVSNSGSVNILGKDGVKGDASSISVATIGASASISDTTINGETKHGMSGTSRATTGSCGCDIFAYNTGNITNTGSVLLSGGVQGTAASVGISTVGATASNSVSNITGSKH